MKSIELKNVLHFAVSVEDLSSLCYAQDKLKLAVFRMCFADRFHRSYFKSDKNDITKNYAILLPNSNSENLGIPPKQHLLATCKVLKDLFGFKNFYYAKKSKTNSRKPIQEVTFYPFDPESVI